MYNSGIVIRDIPEDAYEYIVNDPNLWCEERGDEKYILNLLLRVITVSVETVKIVKGLPLLGIID